MDRQLRYWSEFLSHDKTNWRIELHQHSEGVIYPGQEIRLAPEPLTISWGERTKLEPIESSSVTLNLFSDADRKFIDLYQVKVGAVILLVYRNGQLYWSGTLDTELYEEPYQDRANYAVSMTFSDFAILERKRFSGKGVISISDIVTQALGASEMQYGELVKHISTYYNDAPITLGELYINSENFYDEEGEPLSLFAVLDGVLQPLALKIRQKNGRIFIYDLNALYSNFTPQQVKWSSKTSTLSVDTIYNNANITFSPYADTVIYGSNIQYGAIKPTNTEGTLVPISSGYKAEDGFKVYLADTGDKSLTLSGGAKFVKIEPVHSGSQEAAVAYSARVNKYGSGDLTSIEGLDMPMDCHPNKKTHKTIITTSPKYIVSPEEYRKDYSLKITLDMLFDVRYNPFEDPAGDNDEGNWDKLQNWSNIAYLGVKLYLTNEEGVITHHYDNSDAYGSEAFGGFGKWWTGKPNNHEECYLCFYNIDDRKSKSGLGGWQKNKPIIGFYQGNQIGRAHV